jgi:hypothetical protein
VPLDKKGMFEWIMLAQVILVKLVGVSGMLIFPFFWYMEHHIFKPLISESLLVNVAVVLIISASMFEATQWLSVTCSVALIYTNSIHFWLKFHL